MCFKNFKEKNDFFKKICQTKENFKKKNAIFNFFMFKENCNFSI